MIVVPHELQFEVDDQWLLKTFMILDDQLHVRIGKSIIPVYNEDEFFRQADAMHKTGGHISIRVLRERMRELAWHPDAEVILQRVFIQCTYCVSRQPHSS